MRVRWSRTALEHLSATAAFIARDRPLAARSWVARIEETALRAGRMPMSGRRLPEAPDLGLREFLVSGYRVVYLPDLPREVVVVAVRHASLPLDRGVLTLHGYDRESED